MAGRDEEELVPVVEDPPISRGAAAEVGVSEARGVEDESPTVETSGSTGGGTQEEPSREGRRLLLTPPPVAAPRFSRS